MERNIKNDFTFAHREEGFDTHIEKSIRGYSDLHNDVVKLSRFFVENGSTVIDLGCSTGKTLASMYNQNKDFTQEVEYVGIDYAEGFWSEMEKTKKKYPNIHLQTADVREFEFRNCCLVTSIFTLQFIPRKDRQELLNKIYSGLNDGGAFIFSEKTYSNNSKLQDILTFMHYDHKRQSFDAEDIMEKEVTLRSMLRPNTWDEIEEMLFIAGFRKVQIFWQNYLFVGAVALK